MLNFGKRLNLWIWAFKPRFAAHFLYLVCTKVGPVTHKGLLSARTRTAQVETTSFWITQGGASSCIQAVAQQESPSVYNLGLRPVSLAVRGEQPRLTPLCPPLRHWEPFSRCPQGYGRSSANLRSTPTGNLQPFVLRLHSLTAVQRVRAFHKARTEEKEGKARAEPCLSDKSGSIFLQVKVFGMGVVVQAPL